MNPRFRSCIFLSLILSGAFSSPGVAQGVSTSQLDNLDVGYRRGPPKGWVVAGSAPERYLISTDVGEGAPSGRRFARIESLTRYTTTGTHIAKSAQKGGENAKAPQFATVMQSIRADAYRGKRMRLSTLLKATTVSDAASLWMRVEAQNGKVLGFDNMESHQIVGTTAWQRYDVVLDVPAESATISFGFLLAGTGAVMAADFQFATVDASVATTAPPDAAPERTLPDVPVNLELRL